MFRLRPFSGNYPILFGILFIICLLAFKPVKNDLNTDAFNYFSISLPGEKYTGALDGRLLLMLSTDGAAEPRFQIKDGPNTQLIFGIDVENWSSGEQIIGNAAFGYPIQSLSNVPAGEYYVQVLFHKYETFNRSDGHTVKMPMDRGEGQQWNRAPGNLYNLPQKINFDPESGKTIAIELNQEIPPI